MILRSKSSNWSLIGQFNDVRITWNENREQKLNLFTLPMELRCYKIVSRFSIFWICPSFWKKQFFTSFPGTGMTEKVKLCPGTGSHGHAQTREQSPQIDLSNEHVWVWTRELGKKRGTGSVKLQFLKNRWAFSYFPVYSFWFARFGFCLTVLWREFTVKLAKWFACDDRYANKSIQYSTKQI